MCGLHRDAVDSEERAVRRCLERGEAAAVDELGEEYRSATHERAVEALAAEEDAARGQLVGEEREDMCGLHRDAVDSEERAVRRCLERGEAAAVDELGEEYRSATHERAVEALAAEEDAARGQLVGEEREDMCGLHRDAVDSEERAVRRCLERGEAAAVDELGEEYRSATHERAVEALAAEEDAARGQLVGEEREDMCGLHRDAVDSEERAVRRCLERGEAAAVDELGEEYRSATHERAVEALAAEEDAARGQLVGEEREDMCGLHRDAVDSEERAVRRCLERGEAAAVDELGEEYRSATHERAVEALAAEEDAARGQLVGEEREDMCGLHRDAVDSEERAVRRCLERGEAAAVDELGEEYRSATHERAVEALAAEEDAARGQLGRRGARGHVWIAPRCRGFRGESGAPLPGARRGCSCGRARRGVQERDARASSGGASRGGGRRSRSAGRRGARGHVWIAPRCRGFRGESGAPPPGARRGCSCGRARRGVQERDA
ncbi:Flagellar Member 3 [Trypanosoma cruzi]|nr:Flagellar Member 3 [Trypanosoma cruzi]